MRLDSIAKVIRSKNAGPCLLTLDVMLPDEATFAYVAARIGSLRRQVQLESMAPNRAATPSSVAAHSLYEQADPFDIREPSGRADLRHVTYRALDARRTRVEGATFEPAERQTIKLEGASKIGHRALLLAGAADPRFIARHEEIFAAVSRVVRDLVCEDAIEDYRLGFRLYGVDGVRAWA